MLDVCKFDIPIEPDFDAQFYANTYSKWVKTFYVAICRAHGISEKKRLYFHFYLYGRKGKLLKNDREKPYEINVELETHLWLLIESLTRIIADRNDSKLQIALNRIFDLSLQEPWKSCPIVAEAIESLTTINKLKQDYCADLLSLGCTGEPLSELAKAVVTPLNDHCVKIQLPSNASFLIPTSKNQSGNFRMVDLVVFNHHRSGWEYVIREGLIQFHNSNAKTIVNGFIDKTFIWPTTSTASVFSSNDWVGFLHNPPYVPNCFIAQRDGCTDALLHSEAFRDAKHRCVGLFVLSPTHADYLSVVAPELRVNCVHHPTFIPDVKFNYQSFLRNPVKKLVSIGWWLRRQHTFYRLKAEPYQKWRLGRIGYDTTLDKVLQEEQWLHGDLTDAQRQSVTIHDALSNEEYDQLLSQNIVFIDLYDATANNAIIECIARGTPVLVNPLPGVKYYLGKDYPLYFSSLEEAENKLNNFQLLKDTHDYLMTFPGRKNIQIETFVERIRESEIYRIAGEL